MSAVESVVEGPVDKAAAATPLLQCPHCNYTTSKKGHLVRRIGRLVLVRTHLSINFTQTDSARSGSQW